MKFFDHNDLYIGEGDLPILKHLLQMEITKQKDPVQKQERIIFTCIFSHNEFFTNDQLTASLLYDDESIIKSKGTHINWKKNPTITRVEKKQMNKRTKQTRIKVQEIQNMSFFEAFNDFSIEDDEDCPNHNPEQE